MRVRLHAGAVLGLIVAADGGGVRANTTAPIAGVRALGAPAEAAGDDSFAVGRALLSGSNVFEALAKFRQALVASPQSIEALNAIAVCYDRLGRPDLARSYYEAGLAMDPTSPMLLNNLGYSMYVQMDYAGAIGPLQAASVAADTDIAAIAQRTLALATVAMTPARILPDEVEVGAYIERTSEGEQRLILDSTKLFNPGSTVAVRRWQIAATVETHVLSDDQLPSVPVQQSDKRAALKAASSITLYATIDPTGWPKFLEHRWQSANNALSLAEKVDDLASRSSSDIVNLALGRLPDTVAVATLSREVGRGHPPDIKPRAINEATLTAFVAAMRIFKRDYVSAPNA